MQSLRLCFSNTRTNRPMPRTCPDSSDSCCGPADSGSLYTPAGAATTRLAQHLPVAWKSQSPDVVSTITSTETCCFHLVLVLLLAVQVHAQLGCEGISSFPFLSLISHESMKAILTSTSQPRILMTPIGVGLGPDFGKLKLFICQLFVLIVEGLGCPTS